MTKKLALGIDVLLEERQELIKGKRIGLVTNALTADASGRPVYERLLPHLTGGCVFTPEHGLAGTALAGEKVASWYDRALGLPIHSLYGEVKKPSSEMLTGLDVLVFDLPGLGVRFFTYIATLGLVMEAAAESGLPLVVLDRPAILNAASVEGGMPEGDFRSFVCPQAIPVRYGLTNGELARFIQASSKLQGELEVIIMQGYQRGSYFDELGLPWVNPSAGIRDMETALLYAGTCLVEGTKLSEGRGTACPFRLIGSPGTDAAELQRRLKDIPGLVVEQARFRPDTSKHMGQECHGVELSIIDRGTLEPLRMGIQLLAALIETAEDFDWCPPGEEDGRFHIDQLAGGSRLREHLEKGMDIDLLWREWKKEAKAFAKKRQEFLLY